MPKIENLVAEVFDTHVWVWATAGDERAAKISDFSRTAFVLAISQWEVSMLAMRSRLELKPTSRSGSRKTWSYPFVSPS